MNFQFFNLEFGEKAMILSFFENLNQWFDDFLDDNHTDFLQLVDNSRFHHDINSQSVINAHKEIKPIFHRITLEHKEGALKEIGMTGENLKLKGRILNELGYKVENELSDGRLVLFDGDYVKKLLLKFLNYLNSILKSMAKAIPILDSITEFKEIIEKLLDMVTAR